MHLFVLGNDISPVRIGDHLLATARSYPQLDPTTLWQAAVDGVVAAGIYHSHATIAPRRYVAQHPDDVVGYDGCLADAQGEANVFDADVLRVQWQSFPARVEGQFVAFRLTPRRIEVVTDPLGVHQVYYVQRGQGWLISNSVRLLSMFAPTRSPDEVGVATFLTLGWAAGDRTLERGVRVMPGGVRWMWEDHTREVREERYYPRSALPKAPLVGRSQFDCAHLGDQLASLARSVTRWASVKCPITGGRDSRLLVAILLLARVSAQYYTGGTGPDLLVALKIAESFQLPHTTLPLDDVAAQWTQASRRLVDQNDGMVDLWQTPDILGQTDQVDRLPVNMWGIGGEIARGFYHGRRFLLSSLQWRTLEDFLARAVVVTNPVIKPDAVALSRRVITDFVAAAADEGFRPAAIPDLFYAYERVRRWGGSNNRKTLPMADHFALLCTRPFIEAAFSIPVLNRRAEPLHYQLTKRIPRLHSMPFADEPWRSQIPGVGLLQKRRRHAGSSSAWTTTVLPGIRSFCLDQRNSPLWDFVDRQAFSGASARAVLSAATLFQYFSDQRYP